jgi:hypothetical protein
MVCSTRLVPPALPPSRAGSDIEYRAAWPDLLRRHEEQLLGIQRVAVERGSTQGSGGAHGCQVLRGQSGMAASGANVRELHGLTEQHSKCKAGAEDLPADLAMRAVDHQPVVRHFTTHRASHQKWR